MKTSSTAEPPAGLVSRGQPLLVILGPTAVGKTETSIRLAERSGGEIISADSRLFYRGMDIGTAKPSREEQARIPHHLIDVTTPDQPWSLALFQRAARRAIAGIHARRHLPILVGGTGQYVRAVVEEWEAPHVTPDPKLRLVLERWSVAIGKQGLHARLTVLDPAAAARIDYRNVRRTIRALEVIFLTGRPFSNQVQSSQSPYNLLMVGLERPRPELYARIDARIDAMLAAGLVQEVQALLAQGYPPDLPAFSAIGYREVIAYLRGRLTMDEVVTEMKRATRVFVRRQANWFKSGDPRIRWFQMGENTVDDVDALVKGWLAES